MTAPKYLADLSWPNVPDRPLVLVPIGSIEQHGPHLPFDTDTVIAAAAADACVARLFDVIDTEVVIAPPITYGASGEHQLFPGTISIGHEALRIMLIELVRSLSHWAGRIVLVNGHGGNVPTIAEVVTQLIIEHHDVAWVPCAFEGATDAHAGHDETSVMLFLDPQRVDMERAIRGNTSHLSKILPDLMESGVRAVSESGVLGNPLHADEAQGRRLFDGLVDDLCARIFNGSVASNGQLLSPQLS